MRRQLLGLATFFVPVALIACGSSGGGTGGSGGGTGGGGTTTSGTTTTTTTTSDTTSSSSSTSTSSSSSSTSTSSSSSSGAPSCNDTCIANHPSEFQKFAGYQLKDCGCTSGAACSTKCSTTDCAATDPSQISADCSMCLQDEGGKGLSSTCTTTAAGECNNDNACKAFYSCAICCALGQSNCQ